MTWRARFGWKATCSRCEPRWQTCASTMTCPSTLVQKIMSMAIPSLTRLGLGSAGCANSAATGATQPATHSQIPQRSSSAVDGLAALGPSPRRAVGESVIARGPMVVFSETSHDGTSRTPTPARYGDAIRRLAIQELLDEQGAVSKEDLAEREEKIHKRRQRPTGSEAELRTHAPEAVVTSSPVSVPRAIVNALQSGLAGAQRAAREVRFAPPTAWAV